MTLKSGVIVIKPASNALSCKAFIAIPFWGFNLFLLSTPQGLMCPAIKSSVRCIPVIQQVLLYDAKIVDDTGNYHHFYFRKKTIKNGKKHGPIVDPDFLAKCLSRREQCNH